MTTLKKLEISLLGATALLAIYIAIGMHGSESTLFGATNQCASGQTCLTSLELTGAANGATNTLQIDGGTMVIGASGSSITQVLKGIGSIIGNRSVTASTTAAFDIAVTGAVSGDTCFAMAASTTQTSIGFNIVGCSASTTANFITLLVSNATGAAAVVPYPIASATQFMVIR